MTTDPFELLCKEWEEQTTKRGLSVMSADELLAELEANSGNPEDVAYVRDFLRRWDEVEERNARRAGK